MRRTRNPRRIRFRETLIATAIIAVIGVVGLRAVVRLQTEAPQLNTALVRWEYDNNSWVATSQPPICSQPLFDMSPIDATAVTNVAYPGLEQAGRFNEAAVLHFGRADVTVRLPMAARLIAARQDTDGRYSLVFINSCGIAQRYDGLRTLTSRLNSYFAQNKSVLTTTDIQKQIFEGLQFASGEAIASTVTGTDTGPRLEIAVYDLRGINAIASNQEWSVRHTERPAEIRYGICWIRLLPEADQGRLHERTTMAHTDYCQ